MMNRHRVTAALVTTAAAAALAAVTAGTATASAAAPATHPARVTVAAWYSHPGNEWWAPVHPAQVTWGTQRLAQAGSATLYLPDGITVATVIRGWDQAQAGPDGITVA